MGLHGRQYITYRVKTWTEATGEGVAIDVQHQPYKFTRKDLVEEMEGCAIPGEYVEALPVSWNEITSVRGVERPSGLETASVSDCSPEQKESLDLILKRD